MLCETCKVWELAEGDLYCSWCGKQLFEFEVLTRQPIRFYVDISNPDHVSRVVALRNNSHAPVNLVCQHFPGWLALAVDTSWPVVIEPAQETRLEIRVDPAQLDTPILEDRLTLEVSPGGSRRDLIIQVSPLPEIHISPTTVFRGSTLQADLNLETWYPATVEALSFEPSFLTYKGNLPIDLDIGGSSIPVDFIWPRKSASENVPVAFRFQLADLDRPVTGTFDLTVKNPPTLAILEFEEKSFTPPEVIPDSEDVFSLTIANPGEDTLRITQILVRPLTESPPLLLEADNVTFNVEPDERQLLSFRVSTPPNTKGGNYWFEANFQSNDPNPDNNKRNLLVKVIEEEYSRYVAIDFGTTDSAVAILDEKKHQPVNVSLEDGSFDPKIYSNIFFMDYDEIQEPPFVWCIGTEARKFGPTLVEQFVKAIKTKVGLNHLQEIHFEKKRQSCRIEAEEISRFILMDLLKRTRKSLKKTPGKFILCVPTRFTLRRKEVLRQSFQHAAQSMSLPLQSIEVIDESLAAGLFYLLQRAPNDEVVKGKKEYTLMILDFGGGTTDITVFRVRQRLTSSGRIKNIDEVEIIGAWGDATLGGEEITEEIARRLLEGFAQKAYRNEESRREARQFEDEAEALKLAVSELQRLQQTENNLDLEFLLQQATDLLRSNLGYISYGVHNILDDQLKECLESYLDNDRRLTVISGDFPNKVSISESDVVKIYEIRLEKLKSELNLLLKNIGLDKVDVLLLAGQSSQFPTVARVFGGLASSWDFVRDLKGNLMLKECVSLGALLYSFSYYGGLDFKITGLNRYWTRLGWVRPELGRGQVFKDLIEWRTVYPCESKVFLLSRGHVTGDRLEVEILENLSLGDEPQTEMFGSYRLGLNGIRQEKYPCKLQVTEKGGVRAFCELNQKWVEMELKR